MNVILAVRYTSPTTMHPFRNSSSPASQHETKRSGASSDVINEAKTNLGDESSGNWPRAVRSAPHDPNPSLRAHHQTALAAVLRHQQQQQQQLRLPQAQAQQQAMAEWQLHHLRLLQQEQLQQEAVLRQALARPPSMAVASSYLSPLAMPMAGGSTTDAISSLLLQQERGRLLAMQRQAAAASYNSRLHQEQLMRQMQMSAMPSSSFAPPPAAPAAAASRGSHTAPPPAAAASRASSAGRKRPGPEDRDTKAGSQDLKKPKPATSTARPMAGSPSSSSSSTSTEEGNRFPSEREALEEEVLKAVTSGPCPSPGTASRVLKVLGTTLRSKADRFVDVSRLPRQEAGLGEKRRGASVFFPEILYRLLEDASHDGASSGGVVGWLSHGRGFRVGDKHRFAQEVLPKYFLGQTKWASFSRQLNLYGFLRITSGPDYGAYYHELFLRSRSDLHSFMRRVGKPHLMDRRKHKLADGDDPDLYAYPPVGAAVVAADSGDAPGEEPALK